MDKLKPCPFCGGPGRIESDTEVIGHGSNDIVYFVCCKQCGASTKRVGCLEAEGAYLKKLVATVLWEERVEDGN